MENLYNDLQFWKNVGYYGGGFFVIIGMIVGGISFYQTSKLENLIREETKKEESISRNKFLDDWNIHYQQQKLQENLEKQIEELKKVKQSAESKTQEKLEKQIEELQKIKQSETVPKENFRFENDTQNKILKFWPKVGEWKKPIIAYPSDEKDIVKGNFTSKTGVMFMVLQGINEEHKLVFSVASGGPPATKDHFYGLGYETLPSYVIIGDDGISMWRINLK